MRWKKTCHKPATTDVWAGEAQINEQVWSAQVEQAKQVKVSRDNKEWAPATHINPGN